MDIRKVKKLIELLEESGIAEIEIKEGEEAVRISRMPTGAYATHAPMPMMIRPITSSLGLTEIAQTIDPPQKISTPINIKRLRPKL